MPTHILAQCGWQIGSSLPRDVQVITPHFRHTQVDISDVDWNALASDLANGLETWMKSPTQSQLTVKLYQLGLPKPNRPKATAVRQPGAGAAPPYPPELAICLSFNGGPNAPANRGRVYVPYNKCGVATPTYRPAQAAIDHVGLLPGIFAGLGGANVDWIVWSPTKSAATKVERWYVDDEWDVQRRRGARPNVRTGGTTGG